MTQLIVNADDFGLTEGVNRGIVQSHAGGIVTSTTLLANGAAFRSAVEMSREAPRLAVGVHLNLTQGSPVSSPQTVAALVNARGEFHFTPGQLWKALATRQIPARQIEEELGAQVSKVLEAGIKPTHLDGHMHVHLLPKISEVVVRIARRFGIAGVRCPVEQSSEILRGLRNTSENRIGQFKRGGIAFAVSFFARRLKKKLGREGLLCPSHFWGVTRTGFLDTAVLLAILRSLPDGSSELCCHPGYWSTALEQAGGELTLQREVEMQALVSSEVKSLIEAKAIRLATYADLSDPAR